MKKIFDSGYASNEEIRDVRKLLSRGSVKFYETPSTQRTRSALWVRTEKDYAKAREIIEQYTRELVKISRKEYERRLKNDFDGSQLNWFTYNIKKYRLFIPVGLALILFVVWHAASFVIVNYG